LNIKQKEKIMSKIGLLVCGNSGIDYVEHPYDIDVIRSILLFGQEEYTDFIDITADEFYKKLETTDIVPSTAQAATGVIKEQYEKAKGKGYEELLVVTISNHLSGTYQGAVLAGNMVEDLKVTVFDSKSVAYVESHMILTAAKMVEEGKNLDEIIETLEYIRDHNHLFFSVGTLKYLVKNGRLSGAAGFVGGLMKIKPMLEVTDDGKVESIEKIRTLSKATARLIEKFLESIEGKSVDVYMLSAQAEDRANEVKEAVLEARPDINNINIYPLTPVVGAHAGPGTVAIGYIEK
jgi:DegV family protein with EDD domain